MKDDTEIRKQRNGTIRISKGEAKKPYYPFTGKMKIGNLTLGVHGTSEMSGTKLRK